MAFSVQMPALGESVTEGTVTRWLKQEGESVEVDEPLLEVSTDKVDTEIPSPAAGVLQRIVVKEDETVEVGAELAVIGDSSDGGGRTAQQTESAPEPEPEPESAQQESGQQESARQESAQQESARQESARQQSAQQEPARQESAQQQPNAEQDKAAAEQAPAPAADDRPAASGGTAVTMPALGESVTEGTVTRWLKQVGDHVAEDEPLLEVSTDKVDTEIPSPVAGTLLAITAAEDSTVEVGGQLAVIGSKGAAPAQQQDTQPTPEPARTEAPQAEPRQAEAPKATQQAPTQQAPTQQAPAQHDWQAQQPEGAELTNGSRTGDDTAPYVTPLVRKLAGEHNVDLSTVQGTGVGGRIRKQDVLAAVEEREKAKAATTAPSTPAQTTKPAAPAASAPVTGDDSSLRGTTQKLSRLRQIVAQRTRESLQGSAQLTQVVEVDVTRVAKLRVRAKSDFEQREGVKLTFLPFFAKAVVEALKQHPKLNASIDEEAKQVTYHGAEHLGIAIDTERGLLNAVVHDAGDLNLAGLAHKINDLANRARTNKIGPEELSGGTFSLTNLGSNGALFDTPIIQQPQVGILGVGVVVKRPVVVTDEDGDETIAIRSMVYLSLTYDHRLVDGADAGRFLTTVKHRLQDGEFAADLGL